MVAKIRLAVTHKPYKQIKLLSGSLVVLMTLFQCVNYLPCSLAFSFSVCYGLHGSIDLMCPSKRLETKK